MPSPPVDRVPWKECPSEGQVYNNRLRLLIYSTSACSNTSNTAITINTDDVRMLKLSLLFIVVVVCFGGAVGC